jgi:hypothetical protein
VRAARSAISTLVPGPAASVLNSPVRSARSIIKVAMALV